MKFQQARPEHRGERSGYLAEALDETEVGEPNEHLYVSTPWLDPTY